MLKTMLRAGLRSLLGESRVVRLRYRLGRIDQNAQYDQMTGIIMSRAIPKGGVCIDVGSHDGVLLSWMLQYDPSQAWAFEPLPSCQSVLNKRFEGDPRVRLFDCALSDTEGHQKFQWVRSAPGYSGFRRLPYPEGHQDVCEIEVRTQKLDSLTPNLSRLDFVKIDVEGAETAVLRGAVETLTRFHPVVVFEHAGWAWEYNSGPRVLMPLLEQCGLRISTMPDFLAHRPALTIHQFCEHFESDEYSWVAHV
jgi:FkbM family methyltransferase